MQIIALTGNKGSGKDTVASLIQNRIPGSRTIAFADPIKKVIQHIFDLDSKDTEQYDKFKRDLVMYNLPGYFSHRVPARHIVREIGMLMRSYDDNQFCQYVAGHMLREPNHLWIVTDLRFGNELNMLRNMGAVIVRVKRPGYKPDGHITEQGFEDSVIDHDIINDKDIRALELEVEALMKQIV